MVNPLEHSGRYSDEFTRKQPLRGLTVGRDKGLRPEMPPTWPSRPHTFISDHLAALGPPSPISSKRSSPFSITKSQSHRSMQNSGHLHTHHPDRGSKHIVNPRYPSPPLQNGSSLHPAATLTTSCQSQVYSHRDFEDTENLSNNDPTITLNGKSTISISHQGRGGKPKYKMQQGIRPQRCFVYIILHTIYLTKPNT